MVGSLVKDINYYLHRIYNIDITLEHAQGLDRSLFNFLLLAVRFSGRPRHPGALGEKEQIQNALSYDN